MVRYTTEDLMTVTGLSPDDVKSYIRRNLFTHPIDPPVQGKPRYFDRESVIDFAILAALARKGIALPLAKNWVAKLLPLVKKNRAPTWIAWRDGAEVFHPIEPHLAVSPASGGQGDIEQRFGEATHFIASVGKVDLKRVEAGEKPIFFKQAGDQIGHLFLKTFIQRIDTALAERIKERNDQ